MREDRQVNSNKTWCGYTLGRLAAGIINIQRRAASRAETIGAAADDPGIGDLIEWEETHTHFYLRTFGTSIDEFTRELERRTSREYVRRLLDGYIAARLDERMIA